MMMNITRVFYNLSVKRVCGEEKKIDKAMVEKGSSMSTKTIVSSNDTIDNYNETNSNFSNYIMLLMRIDDPKIKNPYFFVSFDILSERLLCMPPLDVKTICDDSVFIIIILKNHFILSMKYISTNKKLIFKSSSYNIDGYKFSIKNYDGITICILDYRYVQHYKYRCHLHFKTFVGIFFTDQLLDF